MLVENLQRADLNPMDKAEAMGALRKKGHSNVRIAQRIGVTDATVGFYLALLDLDVRSQEAVRRGDLPAADAVGAVRRTRAKARERKGTPAMGPVWEPDHFTGAHPLARKAKALCDGREHSSRRRVGKLACGECWETVIRADERTVVAALAEPGELRSVS
jgi:ParB family transcriptional regulator, chromosome partitioning protein